MASTKKKQTTACTDDACPIEWEPENSETLEELTNGKGEEEDGVHK